MAVANFDELCAGFCEIAGVRAPVLQPDASGLAAFHFKFRGVTVDVMHWPHRCAHSAYIAFAFGALPPGDADRASHMELLLMANFVSFWQPQGTFACNPATSNMVLQYTYSLADATAHALFELVEHGTALALEWRDSAREGALPAEASPAFDSLA